MGHVALLIQEKAPALKLFAPLFNWGTEAVMLFFVLSGAVIRLSAERRLLKGRRFLANRAVRLIPLYVLAVAAAWLTAAALGIVIPPRTLLGNLLFLQSLQGYIAPVMDTNPPLWSLSYEVGFYVLFAVVLARPRFMYFWCAVSILCLWPSLRTPTLLWAEHLRSMLAFSTLWLAGYFIARTRHLFTLPRSFALFCVPLALAISRAHFADTYYDPIRLVGFGVFLLPLFSASLGHGPVVRVGTRPRVLLLLLVLMLFLDTTHSLKSTQVVLSILAILAASLPSSWLDRASAPSLLVRASIYVGSISYAIYIFHFPILRAVFALRLPVSISIVLALAMTWLVSHFLERVIQPRIATLLRNVLPGSMPTRGIAG